MTGKVNRDHFYKLASDLPEERLQAAVSLIKELSSLPLPASKDEWSYVVNRLIKGLSSDRNGARLGFSLCLTEVVDLAIKMDDDKAPEELKSMDSFLHLLSKTFSIDPQDEKKKRKGKEERGLMFGKLFALQALLNEPLFSDIFIKDGKITKFTTKFIDELVNLASRKNWIKQPCLFTLYQTIERLLPYSDDSFVKTVVTVLDVNKYTLTNEGLAIYLLFISKGYSSALLSINVTNKGWKYNNPLLKGNLSLVSEVVRESAVVVDDNETKTNNANWHPKLHFVWDILLPILYNDPREEPLKKKKKHNNGSSKSKSEAVGAIEFPEFWKAIVDETYFSDKASSERKFLGLLIFLKALPTVPSKWIACCFSQNLMRCLINQCSDSERHLHKIAEKCLISIVKTCEADPGHKLVPVVGALLFGTNGSINFDRLTKSKTVAKLIATKGLEDDSIGKLFALFTSELNSQKNEAVLHFILDTLLHILRSHKLNLKGEHISTWLMSVLLLPLVKLGFFHATETSPEDKINVSEIARERIYSILSELSSVPTGDAHSWQFHILNELTTVENELTLTNALDEDLTTVKDTGLSVIHSLSVKNDKSSRGIESLLAMCLLQLYSGEADSVATIKEICDYLTEEKSSKNSISLVGITEILLGLLAQKKTVLTKTSLLVWEQLIEDVGSDELNLILDVLSARENKEGFSYLFEGAEEYEKVSGDENEVAPEEESASSDTSDSSSDSDDESEEADNKDVTNIDRQTACALAKALKLPENVVNEDGEVKFNEIDDLEDESSDDESMDDEAMMALDGQLADIFKRRKDALSHVPTGNMRKIEVRDSRESVINFKQRMIDMLTIYVKYVEKLDLEDKDVMKEKLQTVSTFVEPMLKCVQRTLDRPLADKIFKLLKAKIFKVKIPVSAEDGERFVESLQRIHGTYLLAEKSGQYQAIYYSLCSSASIFFCKLLIESRDNKDAAHNEVIDIYAETTKKWMDKKKFPTSVFFDFYNWLSSKRQQQ
ncbi:DNA-directed DNA polymerase KNAG_0E00970 [Huiozyma naganishii CBS 8797]|uniref:DNA polymerase V n=1 Tax=Huiozyma naganishii (strain ATCC MYA-139 / BCRC 22969 / CBS 8797 / KCTC 17520 / NBRC 10181 / NCYC 3082 / Yp74L-3) TaxID=1071383 RepID=J7R685_HUIN7|nr:hypothetical protein KNAG_0E00970 [Kazachstania naganishii CBS 8797]CCK70365.1 hypothetical protein KNAG_0E00970 [Kazachstania naganishii CBS 8797]